MNHECPRARPRQAPGIQGVGSRVLLGTWGTLNLVRSSDKEQWRLRVWSTAFNIQRDDMPLTQSAGVHILELTSLV